MPKLSLPKSSIRVLLLEGVNESAVAAFRASDYASVEELPKALGEAELIEKISGVHMVGIRSATQLTAPVLAAARKLFCIGCFCIGTNQVDLNAARAAGIPVFNAPYSNTRSVAELVVAEIIMLFRGIPARSAAAHAGRWLKTAAGSREARGKTLGIVGYGHIGTQLSVLAEALGMRVIYFDIVDKLALGNARHVASLAELLAQADVVSLHVPDTPQTRNMIGAAEIALMKKGGYLVNAARGSVVVIEALADALRAGHLAGAALDVFPKEPKSNADEFVSPLRAFDNVILTPHIGGSTEEAQVNIGTEVADKLIRYSDNGSTLGAVNFPEVSLPVKAGSTRFLHIHRNEPGVLRRINDIFASRRLNIGAQYLQTDGEIGYVVVDVDGGVEEQQVLEDLQSVSGTLRARFLW